MTATASWCPAHPIMDGHRPPPDRVGRTGAPNPSTFAGPVTGAAESSVAGSEPNIANGKNRSRRPSSATRASRRVVVGICVADFGSARNLPIRSGP